MNHFPVVLDIETKFTFRDFADPKKLGISVAVLYDYQDKQGKVFFEKDVSKMFPILERSSYIVGYNVKSFDMQVLQGYYPGNVENLQTFDILDEIKEKIGRRLALNDVIHATLGMKKSGHGLMAIEMYKEGRFDELQKYCMDDVMLTKALFEYGIEKGEIFYIDEVGKKSIKVDWKKYMEEGGKKEMSLTLPF